MANLKTLPGVSHLAALQLYDEQGELIATIENKPGQVASLIIYNHLAQLFGAITPEAAKKGLDLYAEYVQEAKEAPGKHPNIDRLLALAAQQTGFYRVKQVFAP
ncbi:MAG: DUF2322 family protein [Rhodocyclaceae bacterium]|nr:DUF2322 family protein [Rhodocyclaceae bacterium]